MIITRAPLRISFVGGGTDLPAFYRPYGPGMVISTTIGRHVYVMLNRKFDRKVSVRYRNHESVNRVEELKHDLIREIFLSYGIEDNIEMVVASEVPAKGSGLGASSALAVALCTALERFVAPKRGYGFEITFENQKYIAERAAQIEIERVGSPIGKQDHYAAAVGGLNFYRFNADETVDIEPFGWTDFVGEIERQSMLFYLNIGHTYVRDGQELVDRFFVPRILSQQSREVDAMRKTYELQRDNVHQLKEHMEYEVIERFMDHVNENWRLKRTLHQEITSPEIEAFVQRAFRSGATAAKVCGAGGGGFVYLMVPPPMQQSVRAELGREFDELRFSFDQKGVEIVFDDENNKVPA